MTLLLSVVTPEYVVQGSDRRVTQGMQVRDDDSVKAVLMNGHTAFAFTGLARLPASELARNARQVEGNFRDTSQWLAEVVSCPATTMTEVLANVQGEASNAIAAVPYALRHCAHAFIGVGWEGTPLEPVLYQVWNFGQGRVRRDFQIAVARLEGEPYGVHSSRPLPPMIDRELQRRIRDCLARDLGPAAVARILVETIRAVARQDRTVGRGIIHVCIPRGPVVELESGREYLLSARTPNRDEITFQFLPAHSDDGVPYSPFMVLGGLITPTLILGQNVLKMEMGRAPAETAEEGEDGGNEVATEAKANDDTPPDSETSESQ